MYIVFPICVCDCVVGPSPSGSFLHLFNGKSANEYSFPEFLLNLLQAKKKKNNIFEEKIQCTFLFIWCER